MLVLFGGAVAHVLVPPFHLSLISGTLLTWWLFALQEGDITQKGFGYFQSISPTVPRRPLSPHVDSHMLTMHPLSSQVPEEAYPTLLSVWVW